MGWWEKRSHSCFLSLSDPFQSADSPTHSMSMGSYLCRKSICAYFNISTVFFCTEVAAPDVKVFTIKALNSLIFAKTVSLYSAHEEMFQKKTDIS